MIASSQNTGFTAFFARDGHEIMGKMQFCAMESWFRDEAVHFLQQIELSPAGFVGNPDKKWVWKHEVYPNSSTYPHLSPVLWFFSNKITISPGVHPSSQNPLTYVAPGVGSGSKTAPQKCLEMSSFFTGYRDAFDVTECHLIIVAIYWTSWFSSETWWNHSHTKVLWWSKSFGVAVFAQEPGSSLSDHLAVLTERKTSGQS